MGRSLKTVFPTVASTECLAFPGDARVNVREPADLRPQQPGMCFQDQNPFVLQAPECDLVMALVDRFRFCQECLVRALESLNPADSVTPFATVQECVASERTDLDLILYYLHENDPAHAKALANVAVLRLAYPTVPLVVLSDADAMQHSSLSRSLLESGVHSVIPTRTSGVLTTIASIRSAKASGTLMAPIPSARLRDKTMPATEGHRRLTSKELMVFALLKRGDANKIIAHELSMSENTVKIHVRNIIRKMQATNRTQAVDKARMLWDSID